MSLNINSVSTSRMAERMPVGHAHTSAALSDSAPSMVRINASKSPADGFGGGRSPMKHACMKLKTASCIERFEAIGTSVVVAGLGRTPSVTAAALSLMRLARANGRGSAGECPCVKNSAQTPAAADGCIHVVDGCQSIRPTPSEAAAAPACTLSMAPARRADVQAGWTRREECV